MLSAVSFEDVTEQTQRLSMKCAEVRQEVFASPGFSAQNKARRSLKVNLYQSREAQYGPRGMYCSGEAAVLKLASSQITPSSLPSSRLSFHVKTRRDSDQEKEYQQENRVIVPGIYLLRVEF